MSRSKTYVLDYDPFLLARICFANVKRMWDAQRELKIRTLLSLKGQHGEARLFSGPLCLEAVFYIRPKCALVDQSNKSVYRKSCIVRPSIRDCFKFVFNTSNKIIYKSTDQIAEIRTKKIYDKHPRVEFTISEIA